MTVELDLDGADVVRSAFYRSRIRSDERLDYDRVDRIFAGEEEAAEPWAAPLAAARAASAALRERRDAAGALAVESSEPEFAFDRAGHVASVGGLGADRVPSADRAPDDRGQRGGRAVAQRA